MGRQVGAQVTGAQDLLNTNDRHHEKLLGLKADVLPDGTATTFTCVFTNGPAFRFKVPLEEIGLPQNTICQASALMVIRSRWAPDGGNRRLLELCDAALRPADTTFMVDPVSGDRLVIHQFDNHAPLVIRHTVEEVEELRARYAAAVAKSMS